MFDSDTEHSPSDLVINKEQVETPHARDTAVPDQPETASISPTTTLTALGLLALGVAGCGGGGDEAEADSGSNTVSANMKLAQSSLTPGVLSFTLINADNNTPILTSTTGNVTLELNGNQNINVRADTTIGVKSVRFTDNFSNESRIESSAPYAYKGNSGSTYTKWKPAPGTYVIYALPFSGTNLSGTQGELAQLTLTIKAAQSGTAPTPVVEVAAARFLAQSAMGCVMDDLKNVQTKGPEGWINEQLSLPIEQTYIAWFKSKSIGNNAGRSDFDRIVWKRFLTNKDQLRQRMTFALSQIFVIDVDAMPGGWWPPYLAGHFMDLLEKNAFGNFRTLLEDVSLSLAMGFYLTHKGSKRADGSGRSPDENYAREIMQLFTIGVEELNPDGSPKLDAFGKTIETYTNEDIKGLAKVFTGWNHREAGFTPRAVATTTPMQFFPEDHENGPKTFLGLTIPANTSGPNSLKLALDHLFKHPNVPPFIARQLIQRFVTSNPSRDYVKRVATVFANNGSGVRGDLGATLRALLLDKEARDRPDDNQINGKGKLREPVLRFTAWARASRCSSPDGQWRMPQLDSPSSRLGQSPGRAPSVFNFFRPGYTPPNTKMAEQGLVAPEFQITTETSVIGYLNFMQECILDDDGVFLNTLQANYGDWLTLANDPGALVQRANLLLAAGGLTTATLSTIQNAVSSMPATSPNERKDRVQATMLLTMASPDALVLR